MEHSLAEELHPGSLQISEGKQGPTSTGNCEHHLSEFLDIKFSPFHRFSHVCLVSVCANSNKGDAIL